MKKVIFLLLLLPAIILAAPVDPNFAQQIAENFINAPEVDANGVVKKVPQKRKRMVRAPKSVTHNQQFYLFNSEEGDGFVIISADDVAHPVLGYSQSGNLDVANMPNNLRWWLSEYDRQIRWAQDNNIEQSEEIAQEWQQILARQTTTATPIVEPLITTKWDQQAPYNNLCPIYSGTQRAATGCVATSTAQVMNYWKYPTKGIGQYSYTTDTRGFQLSANFENTTYDWKNMINEYSYYEYSSLFNKNTYHEVQDITTAQKNAVSTLMYHVGIACQMDYAKKGEQSASSNGLAALALLSYFDYDRSINYITKDTHSDLSWFFVITQQLDKHQPVLYQGTGGDEGHSFICDGYDNKGYFHFNWGWSGLEKDSYYALTALKPTSTGTGAAQGIYTYNQDAIVNIKPNVQSSSYNLQLMSDIKTSVLEMTYGQPFTIEVDIWNVGYTNFSGNLYAVLSDGSNVVYIDTIHNCEIENKLALSSINPSQEPYKAIFHSNGLLNIKETLHTLAIFYEDNDGNFGVVGGDYYMNGKQLSFYHPIQIVPGKYVIVANRDKEGDQNWYYMTSDLGTASTKRFQAVNSGVQSLNGVAYQNLDSKYVWDLEADGDKWKLKNGSKYVTWTTGNSANLGTTAKSLTFEIAENQVQAHFNDGTNERYLALNATAGNNYFAFYSATNQITYLYFIPYDEGTTPPEQDCESVPYSETFASSQGDFTILNKTLPSSFTSIWYWDSKYGMVAKCIKGSTKYESESWLISPCIELPANESCLVSFSHAAKFFQNTDQMSMWISTNYDESAPDNAQWTRLVVPTYPTGANWNWFESGEIDLSAYKGQYVNIAFCYKSNTNYAPQWQIKNFAVNKKNHTALDEIDSSSLQGGNRGRLIFKDGQILILRGDKTYTVTGAEVK